MEPRELWERHSVLASAFCGSDDQVREAQGVLDEAQAGRTRMLAAFAVTVGSDCAVANLLGLNEREVRLARRTVGKDDARTVAKHLLTVTPDDHRTAGPVPVDPPTGSSATGFGPGAHATDFPAAEQTVPPPPVPAPHSAHAPSTGVPVTDSAWSAALDAVLVGGWHTGLDLTALASEFGLELAHLVARAQRLSAEGRLNQPSPHEDRAGRHRRLDAAPPTELGGHASGAPSGHAVPYPRNNDDITWQQISTHTPSWDSSMATQTDWNGIVSHWHHTAAPLTQPWEPANQYT
ncbi:hypothetical protein [Streptomyces sp. NPDC059092]|uniref:hypothetical protein n=1 Tax=Streptomyces sp. NPDC059092 TaxID=3346725 RepID=UPI0036841151